MEPRGLTESIGCCKKEGEPLGRKSDYGKMGAYRALKKQASGDGPPDKLSLLRQKLSQKPSRSRSSGSTHCMTGSIGAMCWRQHGNGCGLTRARPEWTA